MSESAPSRPLSDLALSDCVGRHGEALCAQIDGEVVALNAAKGICYGLDQIASHIWTLIETPTSITEVCAALVATYAVDAPTCERQVIAFLQDLRVEGLLVVHPERPAGQPGA